MWCVAKRGIRSLSKESIDIQKTPLRRHYSLSDSLIERRSLVAGLLVIRPMFRASLVVRSPLKDEYDNITITGRLLPKREGAEL